VRINGLTLLHLMFTNIRNINTLYSVIFLELLFYVFDVIISHNNFPGLCQKLFAPATKTEILGLT
jgi:hypothetical protein